ncbi:MAG: class I SAM-dependent methyltransferase [archaeon]|nr:class I SAM-dependent methyltransferase [archaeon]
MSRLGFEELKVEKERRRDSPLIRYKLVYTIMKRGKLSLDVGCGDSGNIIEFHKKTITIVGLDISLNKLGRMHRIYPHAEYVLGTATALPFRENLFDNVLLVEVLEHIGIPRLAVEEALRVAKDEGKIIITVPNENALYRRLARFLGRRSTSLDEDPTHLTAFTYEKLKILVEKFKVKYTRFHPTRTPLPLLWTFPIFGSLWSISKIHPTFGCFLCVEVIKGHSVRTVVNVNAS